MITISKEFKVWFTSDLHLGHDKAFLYEPRGFSNIHDHDEAIIKNWNSVVDEEDIVFILGDLMLGDNDAGMIRLSRMKGEKYVIRGNHDTDTRWALYEEHPEIIHTLGYSELMRIHGRLFYLSHFPTATYNKEKKPSSRIINVSGHTHSNAPLDVRTNSFNVALDARQNTPVNVDTIIAESDAIVMPQVKTKIEDDGAITAYTDYDYIVEIDGPRYDLLEDDDVCINTF